MAHPCRRPTAASINRREHGGDDPAEDDHTAEPIDRGQEAALRRDAELFVAGLRTARSWVREPAERPLTCGLSSASCGASSARDSGGRRCDPVARGLP